jgi:Arc/MetJ family transcription regulator
VAKTLVDIDEDALVLAMAHYGTTVKREAINRALKEVAERRLRDTDDLEGWITSVGARLAETSWPQAWRQ